MSLSGELHDINPDELVAAYDRVSARVRIPDRPISPESLRAASPAFQRLVVHVLRDSGQHGLPEAEQRLFTIGIITALATIAEYASTEEIKRQLGDI